MRWWMITVTEISLFRRCLNISPCSAMPTCPTPVISDAVFLPRFSFVSDRRFCFNCRYIWTQISGRRLDRCKSWSKFQDCRNGSIMWHTQVYFALYCTSTGSAFQQLTNPVLVLRTHNQRLSLPTSYSVYVPYLGTSDMILELSFPGSSLCFLTWEIPYQIKCEQRRYTASFWIRN